VITPAVCCFVVVMLASLPIYAQNTVVSKGNKNININNNYGLIIQTNLQASSETKKNLKKELNHPYGVDKNWQTILTPGNGTFRLDPRCGLPSNATVIRLGGGPGGSTAWCTADHCVAVSTPDTTLLAFVRVGKFLELNAKVFGADGRIVASIENNKLYVNRNNAFRWSRPDAHAIEVIDQQDRKALSVRFVNSHTVVIEGIFFDRAGDRLDISSDQMKSLSESGGITLSGACMNGSGILFGKAAPR
jgi:hypothetical protein